MKWNEIAVLQQYFVKDLSISAPFNIEQNVHIFKQKTR